MFKFVYMFLVILGDHIFNFQVGNGHPPVLQNFSHAFSPDLTDCPWVSKDGI